MTKDDIHLLFEYDRWANSRVLDVSSALTDEQFMRTFGGTPWSVRNALVHIVAGEWIWLDYWKQPPYTPEMIKALVGRRDVLFATDSFLNVAALRAKWMEIAREQAQFVDSLTDEALGQMLPFRTTKVRLSHLMQHLANHSTYHRGQVALMMRQIGVEPVVTDFHVFLVDGTAHSSLPSADAR